MAESVNPNVWIDDDLLSSARGLIEANMSSVQISTILEKIESHFERLDWSEKEANHSLEPVILGMHRWRPGMVKTYYQDYLSGFDQSIQLLQPHCSNRHIPTEASDGEFGVFLQASTNSG